MNVHFHSDQHEKINTWAGNMLFYVDVNMKWFRFNDSESTLSFLETLTLYTEHFQI